MGDIDHRNLLEEGLTIFFAPNHKLGEITDTIKSLGQSGIGGLCCEVVKQVDAFTGGVTARGAYLRLATVKLVSDRLEKAFIGISEARTLKQWGWNLGFKKWRLLPSRPVLFNSAISATLSRIFWF